MPLLPAFVQAPNASAAPDPPTVIRKTPMAQMRFKRPLYIITLSLG